MEFNQPFECPACKQKSMLFQANADGVIYPYTIINERHLLGKIERLCFEAVCTKCLHFILFDNCGMKHLELIDNKVKIGK